MDCPELDNCIEEVLESGTCCASCLQKGCTCEGYQYYDCINAGFKNGKVPEGDSYFVDYGSTECSCPLGGGRISCHFISCPDLPPNCIEVLEPADGCMQCGRFGCIFDGHKYEAGHSFHIDYCRVCHCPSDGGKLICYPVPDCDVQKVQEPVFATPSEESSRYPYSFDQKGHIDQPSTPFSFTPNGNLPLFREPHAEKDDTEDYDYGPTDVPETYPQTLVFPTQMSSSKKVVSVSHGFERPDSTSSLQSFGRRGKLELRERYGVHGHPADGEEVTEGPLRKEQSTDGPHMHRDSNTSWQPSHDPSSVQSVTFSDLTTQTDFENPSHAHGISDPIIPQNPGLESEKEYPLEISETAVNHQRGSESKTQHQNVSDTVTGSSVSRDEVSHPVQGTDSQTSQQRESNRVSFPLFMLRSPESPIHPQAGLHDAVVPSLHWPTELQGTVAPNTKEGTDEAELKEEEETEDRDIVSFQSVTGSEGGESPYKTKSSQHERGSEGSESSDPTSSYEKSIPGESISSSSSPDHLTTPTMRFITTTSTQPPVKFALDESRRPGQGLFSLHREDQEEAEVTEKEEKKDGPVLTIEQEEGKLKELFTSSIIIL